MEFPEKVQQDLLLEAAFPAGDDALEKFLGQEDLLIIAQQEIADKAGDDPNYAGFLLDVGASLGAGPRLDENNDDVVDDRGTFVRLQPAEVDTFATLEGFAGGSLPEHQPEMMTAAMDHGHHRGWFFSDPANWSPSLDHLFENDDDTLTRGQSPPWVVVPEKPVVDVVNLPDEDLGLPPLTDTAELVSPDCWNHQEAMAIDNDLHLGAGVVQTPMHLEGANLVDQHQPPPDPVGGGLQEAGPEGSATVVGHKKVLKVSFSMDLSTVTDPVVGQVQVITLNDIVTTITPEETEDEASSSNQPPKLAKAGADLAGTCEHIVKIVSLQDHVL